MCRTCDNFHASVACTKPSANESANEVLVLTTDLCASCSSVVVAILKHILDISLSSSINAALASVVTSMAVEGREHFSAGNLTTQVQQAQRGQQQ